MPGTMPHQVVDTEAFYVLPVSGRVGEILGHFRGLAIHEQVRDRRGDLYSFMGLAPVLPDGRIDVEHIGRDQWLVDGRLIYVRQPRGAD
ncbi:hypothetical protein [Oleomonas cavernae]|nr:hypothetical protein [Oleomonas cavernae]